MTMLFIGEHGGVGYAWNNTTSKELPYLFTNSTNVFPLGYINNYKKIFSREVNTCPFECIIHTEKLNVLLLINNFKGILSYSKFVKNKSHMRNFIDSLISMCS